MSKENTNDSILVMLNPDGLAEIYDDTYDITIHCESSGEQETVSKMLERLQGWIPVEERLPEKRGNYLCTVGCEGCRYIIVGHYNKPGWTDDYAGQKVIAWMPLPEPYKGADND